MAVHPCWFLDVLLAAADALSLIRAPDWSIVINFGAGGAVAIVPHWVVHIVDEARLADVLFVVPFLALRYALSVLPEDTSVLLNSARAALVQRFVVDWSVL